MLVQESASLRYHVYQFSDKTDTFDFMGPNLPKNRFWDRNFKNLSLDSESASLRHYVHQFSYRTDNFDFLAPNLPKIGFWCRNFENQSLDSESTPPIYHVCQFSVKMDNFWFFGLNLGKLPNYVQYFRLNVVEGVAEKWVETEMSWVEVDGAEWMLKWAGWRWMELGGGWDELGGCGWSWVELGGAGWSWVELGAWFSNTLKNLPFCAGYWHVVEYNLGGQTQSTLTKWTAKVGVLVKDLHIFLRYSFEVFACFLRKWRFFSILNK